jgi:DNA-binding transcriptional LysR family regulator
MKRMDMNLLVALDALLREQSVSRAAHQVGIGQPAMSASLARLRILFGDELLVRTPKGMEPTPRARALDQPLRQLMLDVRSLVEEKAQFDPSSCKRTFRLSGGDYVGMTVLPPLMAVLRDQAPGIDLRFRFVEKSRIETLLDNDEVDVALYVCESLPNRFKSEPLFEENFVCVVRAGHPLLLVPWTLSAFSNAEHLLVTERGDETGAVDQQLRLAGMSRRIAITVPSAALVSDLLRATNLVATVGARAARRMAQDSSIVAIPPPLPMPSWRMSMVWHGRNSADEGLTWLRGRLTNAAQAGDGASDQKLDSPARRSANAKRRLRRAQRK